MSGDRATLRRLFPMFEQIILCTESTRFGIQSIPPMVC
jgi:hypothetical protein